MAVSPQMLERDSIEEAKKFESIIDSRLRNYRVTKGQIISISVPPGMMSVHFSIVKDMYEEAGWSEVKWNSDQREGNWLSFKY